MSAEEEKLRLFQQAQAAAQKLREYPIRNLSPHIRGMILIRRIEASIHWQIVVNQLLLLLYMHKLSMLRVVRLLVRVHPLRLRRGLSQQHLNI